MPRKKPALSDPVEVPDPETAGETAPWRPTRWVENLDAPPAVDGAGPGLHLLALRVIRPSPLNPRKEFDQEALEELAISIRMHGIMEPLIVRPYQDAGLGGATRYELIAGERRWRAAHLAELAAAPCIVREVDDRTALEMMVVENLQRRDIDALEEARAYQQLLDLGWRQGQVAERTGRPQSSIANALRLLKLPQNVQDHVREGKLTVGHAKALARFADFPAVAARIADLAVAKKVGVRELEKGIPFPYELDKGKNPPARSLDWNTPFNWKDTCKKCPFGAYRANEGGYSAFCFHPAHYEELVAAHKEQERAAAAAFREAAAAPGGDAQALPLLSSLKYNQYENLSYSSNKAKGCGPACPCYGLARDAEGKEVPICTDPKRLQKLKAAETRERKKAHNVTLDELWNEVSGQLAGAGPISCDARAMALLCAKIIHGCRLGVVRDAVAQLGAPVDPELIGGGTYSDHDKRWEAVVKLHPSTQLRLAVECLLREKFREGREYQSTPREALWYLERLDGQAKRAPAEEAAAGPTVTCCACGAQAPEAEGLTHWPLADLCEACAQAPEDAPPLLCRECGASDDTESPARIWHTTDRCMPCHMAAVAREDEEAMAAAAVG